MTNDSTGEQASLSIGSIPIGRHAYSVPGLPMQPATVQRRPPIGPRTVASRSGPQEPLASLDNLLNEGYCEMEADLRRLQHVWLQRVQSEVKRGYGELASDMRRFEEEKTQAWEQLEQDREREYQRISEQRLKNEGEHKSAIQTIQQERTEARRRIEESLMEHESICREEMSSIHSARHEHQQEVGKFEDERNKIVDVSLASQNIVEINIGGTVFEAARQTLCQQRGSFLEGIFSGRHNIKRDRHNRIFVDRDAQLFRGILNYLRQPSRPPYVSDQHQSQQLVQEADYYGVRFYPYPLVFALGGQDSSCFHSNVEVLDVAQQIWQPVREMNEARAFAGAAALGGRIYVYGGQNENYRALCDVELYDILLDQWLPAASLHTPRRSLAACSAHSRLYAIGGFDAENVLSSCEAMDPRTRSWHHIASLPEPRSSAAATVVENSASGFPDIFMSGGSFGKRSRGLYRYDVRANAWETLPPSSMLTEARSGGCLVAVYGSLFAVGGIDDDHVCHASIERLDVDAGRALQEAGWRILSPLDQGRVEAAAVSVSESIMVAGGLHEKSSLKRVDFFRPDQGTWSAGPPLLAARHGLNLVVCNL